MGGAWVPPGVIDSLCSLVTIALMLTSRGGLEGLNDLIHVIFHGSTWILEHSLSLWTPYRRDREHNGTQAQVPPYFCIYGIGLVNVHVGVSFVA